MDGTARTTENWARMLSDLLEHIEQHGSVRGLLVPNQGKQRLVTAAIERGLIVWDKTVGKYYLTATGSARLASARHKIATST
jgi:hypothetical protein